MSASQETKPAIDLSAIGSREEPVEARTIESRIEIRDKVAEDIAAFLSKGGSINEIAPDVTADPPRKPESNYGSRAI